MVQGSLIWSLLMLILEEILMVLETREKNL
jgi:hypothetical protein